MEMNGMGMERRMIVDEVGGVNTGVNRCAAPARDAKGKGRIRGWTGTNCWCTPPAWAGGTIVFTFARDGGEREQVRDWSAKATGTPTIGGSDQPFIFEHRTGS
ncbi:MAG TPA: hypothetical protein VF771_01900 [Longimicrobiaceae bacterium]